MKKHIISVLLLLCIIISTTAPISYASSSLTVKDVSSGGFFNAAILSDSSLWMWGEWFYIGPEPQGDGSIPEKIMTDVKNVSCGRAHTMILKNNGDLYVMGLYGGLGLSDIVGSESCLTVPTKIMSDVIYIDAGGGESCAVTTDGSLYVWYDDFDGNATTKPEKVMSDVINATVGEGYWLAVKNDNTLWACGENNYGQLGDGTTENRETPVKIMDDVKFVDTAYWGWSSTAAIKTDSTLWTWGLNRHGQLGNNGYYDKQIDILDFNGEIFDTYDIVVTPKKILYDVKSVNSTPQYMCAILENGNLYEWGCLEWPDAVKTPVYVMNNVRYAENANDNGIAIKNNNTLWVWGYNHSIREDESDLPMQYDVLSASSVFHSYPFYFSKSFVNQGGENISSNNIADITKVKMTLSKLHTGDHTGVFLIAFYGAEDRLIYVKNKTATISEDIDEVEIDITEDVSSAYKVKAFAWKDLSSIQPICEVLEENIINE